MNPLDALRSPELRGVAQALAEALEALRREVHAEVAEVRRDLSVLRAVLAVDDQPVRRALEALDGERLALDTLAAEVPRLTGSEIQQRLSAMQARLYSVDEGLQ